MNQDEREVYYRLRRIAELDTAVAVTVRTEDLLTMLNAYNRADTEVKVRGLQLMEEKSRVEALKKTLSSELHRYNQASDTINYQTAELERRESLLMRCWMAMFGGEPSNPLRGRMEKHKPTGGTPK